MKYNVKVNDDGYVVDITKLPAPKDYKEIDVEIMPKDIMSGCYKIDKMGKLKLDKKKQAQRMSKIKK